MMEIQIVVREDVFFLIITRNTMFLIIEMFLSSFVLQINYSREKKITTFLSTVHIRPIPPNSTQPHTTQPNPTQPYKSSSSSAQMSGLFLEPVHRQETIC